MKTSLLSLLIALVVLNGTPALAGESLNALLKKRTLDKVDVPKVQTLAGGLSELSARYKAKYGEELPIFIAVDLLPDPSAPKPKPEPPPTIPGIEPAEPAPDPAHARIGIGLYNVPLIEMLRYYAGLSGTAFTIRGDAILFHKAK